MEPLATSTPMIGISNGIPIVVFLGIIFFALRKMMPNFCYKCTHIKKRDATLGLVLSCKEECIYNPPWRGRASHSMFETKEMRARSVDRVFKIKDGAK